MAIPVKPNNTTHKITLPISKKVLEFREFSSKEQFDLLLAKEKSKDENDLSNVIDTIGKVANSCILNGIDITKESIVDFEYYIINLRIHSVGDMAENRYKCNNTIDGKTCNHVIDVKIDLKDIKIDDGSVPDNMVKIDDNIVLEMKYPDYGTISVLTTPNLKDSVLFAAIASCIKTIWAGDDEYKTSDFSQEEVIEFVENLSIKQEDKIADFFNKIPKLNKKISFKCDKCGQEYNFEVEGITDFFG